MSCRDLRSGAVGLLAASLLLAVSGCSAGAAAEPAAASSATAADDLTRRIAEVEAARQCAVSSLSFPDEAGITEGGAGAGAQR